MRRRDKVVDVYDIEVFPNIFHCIDKNTEPGEYYKFEISSRKVPLPILVDFFWTIREQSSNTDKIFAGYNNIHYDNPIINYIISYHQVMKNKSYLQICDSIFN